MRISQNRKIFNSGLDKIKSAVYNASYTAGVTCRGIRLLRKRRMCLGSGIRIPDIVCFYSGCSIAAIFQIMQSEKKKEGRSAPGHFVLCDVQKSYSENLIKVLTEKFRGGYRFHLFHDIGKASDFSSKVSVDIFVAAEEFEREDRRKVTADRRFLLCETRGRREKAGEIPVFRYQPAEKIMKEIREGGIRGKTRMTEKMETSGNEREDQDPGEKKKDPNTLTSVSLKGVIGVYSPVHRIGKTRFAIRMGKQLSQKFPVLYLNLEGNAGGNYYFPEDPGQDIGDLLYYMRQDGINPGMKISTMAGQSDGMDYIMPMKYEQDIKTVKKEEWLALLDIILEKCIYETVILDLGDCVDGLYDILRKCVRVYTLYIDEEAASAKIEQYEKNVRAAGYSDVLGKTVKRRVGRVRRTEGKQAQGT